MTKQRYTIIRYTIIIIIKYNLTIHLAKFSKHFLFEYFSRLNCDLEFTLNSISKYSLHISRRWFLFAVDLQGKIKVELRGFPKIDHSGSSSRLRLQLNPLSPKSIDA